MCFFNVAEKNSKKKIFAHQCDRIFRAFLSKEKLMILLLKKHYLMSFNGSHHPPYCP